MPALDPRLEEQIRDHLSQRIDPQTYRHWLANAPLEHALDGTIDVGVPNQFACDYFEKSFRVAIEEAVNISLGMPRRIQFVVRPDAVYAAGQSASEPEPQLPPPVPPAAVVVRVPEPRQNLVLNPDYTFDQFVVGPSNRLAHAAAIAVSEAPGKAYNPLFIHGSVGLGKTHLLQAVCHALRARSPNLSLNYLPCEEFVNEYIASLKEQKIEQFRTRYRSVDVLLVDDIHFLANKTSSQEEFFHMFNALKNASKQLVFSSDAPPGDIPTLSDRLISRFQWGLVVRLDKPVFETRVSIVRQKALQRGVTFPDDVLEFVALHVDTNIRDIESATLKIIATSMVDRRPIDLDLAKRVLQDQASVPIGRLTIADIQNIVSRHFGVKLSDLQSRKRNRSISQPRQVAAYLVRTMLGTSLEEIGAYFGGKDHTTILYSVRKVAERCEQDFQFKAVVDRLASELRREQQR